jgi:hypothetical protein
MNAYTLEEEISQWNVGIVFELLKSVVHRFEECHMHTVYEGQVADDAVNLFHWNLIPSLIPPFTATATHWFSFEERLHEHLLK